jgi:phytoene synthase
LILPTRRILSLLEEPYRSRAVPPGSTRYWSWLFAAREARAPLLGVYALLAEWRALADSATEIGVAQVKLAWWHDEMQRLAAGSPVHPISRYLADLPEAEAAALSPLTRVVAAVAAQVAGAPLESAAQFGPHSYALYGMPLNLTARLAGIRVESPGLRACTASLAAADYLARAIAGYRREARIGRVAFAVDELLAARIDNADLTAEAAPPRLLDYLDLLRQRAAGYFSAAAAALPPDERPAQRHLMVLAALGSKHLNRRPASPRPDFRLADLYWAWSAARRAASNHR